MYKAEIPGKLYFNPSTASKQAFSLPTDVIKYVIKGCDFKLWLKLLQSCKYFCSKQKVLKNISFCKDGSVDVAGKHIIKFWKIVNELPCQIHLAGQLNIYFPITTLIPKIGKSEIKKLSISGIEIEFEEFKFLIESDLLEIFIIRDAKVIYKNKSIVQLEDIFTYLPNITSLTYLCTNPIGVNANKSINEYTFYEMAEKFRKIKLHSFYFEGITDLIADDFISFIRQAAKNCKISLQNIFATTDDFERFVEKMLQNWESQSFKPSVLYIRSAEVLRQQRTILEQNEVHECVSSFRENIVKKKEEQGILFCVIR